MFQSPFRPACSADPTSLMENLQIMAPQAQPVKRPANMEDPDLPNPPSLDLVQVSITPYGRH